MTKKFHLRSTILLRHGTKKIGEGGNDGSKTTVKAVFELLGDAKINESTRSPAVTAFLRENYSSKGAKEVWASDTSSRLITIAKENYPSNDIHYSVRDGANFSGFPKSYFDAVIIHQGIFYIKDIASLVRGVARVLKPKGSLIFTLLHPLFASARQAVDRDIHALEVQQEYLKVRKIIVTRSWGKNCVSFLTYKRPISYYINACGRNGLLIESMIEPKAVLKMTEA